MVDVADEHFEVWVKYHKAFEKYKRLQTKPRNWAMDVRVYWGDAGTGKTRRAFEEFPNAYIKPHGKWWDDYDGQECVILDDFYGWLPWSFMLQLLDRYPLQVETKGGSVQFTSKVIIITSNVDTCGWYDFDSKPHMKIEALERRISSKVHFNSVFC